MLRWLDWYPEIFLRWKGYISADSTFQPLEPVNEYVIPRKWRKKKMKTHGEETLTILASKTPERKIDSCTVLKWRDQKQFWRRPTPKSTDGTVWKDTCSQKEYGYDYTLLVVRETSSHARQHLSEGKRSHDVWLTIQEYLMPASHEEQNPFRYTPGR